MKKITLVFTILLSTVFTNVYGQNVKLSVKLNPVVSLTVAQKEVLIEFGTVEDYRNGKASEKQVGHLNAFSVGPYKISAKASTEALESTGSESIDLAKIQIIAETAGESAQTTELKYDGSTLYQSDKHAFDKSIDVTYKALVGEAKDFYLSKHFNGKNPSVFTTNVIYTIEVK